MEEELKCRLFKAKGFIEEAYLDENLDLATKYAKNFRGLYAECYAKWYDDNFKENKEFYLAEYLKFLLILTMTKYFSFDNTSTYGIEVIVRNKAQGAGIKSVV